MQVLLNFEEKYQSNVSLFDPWNNRRRISFWAVKDDVVDNLSSSKHETNLPVWFNFDKELLSPLQNWPFISFSIALPLIKQTFSGEPGVWGL